MGTRAVYISSLCLLLLGCRGKDYERHIFIPDGYEGPVKVQFEVETSKNKIIKYRENGEDKAFFIFITGDPRLYEVCDEPMPSGYYTTHSYYYSYDTLYEINTNGSMSDVLDSKYPIAANHGTLGAVNTGLSSYFWVYRDENTDSKRDSLVNAAEKLWEIQEGEKNKK